MINDSQAFEQFMLDNWKEQGYIEAQTEPSGKVKEGEPMSRYGIHVIRYQIENMNTHEKRIFNSYHEALKDYNLLATTDNRAHGCWRLIALLKEQVY